MAVLSSAKKISPRLLIHRLPPTLNSLSQNTVRFKCFKTQWFWFCNIWLLLPSFSIRNDTFSNYLLHSLNFICFGHASKTLFKIPYLLDFQKFSSPPKLLGLRFIWHLGVCETQETFDFCYFFSRNWMVTGTQKCKEFIWYVFVILDWEMSVSRPRPTRNKFG